MDTIIVFFVVLVAVLALVMMFPAYCKCKHCGYKIRPYEIHKCKVSGRRITCK